MTQKKILLSILFVAITIATFAKRKQSYYPFSEELYVVSNYTNLNNKWEKETRSINDLIQRGVRGFILSLELDSNRVYAHTPQDKLIPAEELLQPMTQFLDNNTDELLVLFLNYSFSSEHVINLFRHLNVHQKIWVEEDKGQWPGRKLMTNSGKQIVLFTMNDHSANYSGFHYLWNYAVEPFQSFDINPSFGGDYKNGVAANAFLFFNGYNLPSDTVNIEIPFKNFKVVENPFLVAHLINLWQQTGKKPNFLVCNKFRNEIIHVANNVLFHRSVRGTITQNGRLLNNILWQGSVNANTSGSFSFPFLAGEDFEFQAEKSGYNLVPNQIKGESVEANVVQNIIATPIPINSELQAFYPFDKGIKDASVANRNGTYTNGVFIDDEERGQVIQLKDSQYVDLPSAVELGIYNNDLTVSSWVKVDSFALRDLNILGTEDGYYRKGLHMQFRDKRPYFGFFSNDLNGNTQIQKGRWYHLVWRYSKHSGEQAIFVNGRLDAKSKGHPSFMGRSKLKVGKAINQHNFFHGVIDDLAIWNRPLGDEEIWNLYQDVYDLSKVSFIDRLRYQWKWYVTIAVACLVFLLIWLFRLVNRKSKRLSIALTEPELPQVNAIHLFGGFRVFDKEGNDITSLFTPKMELLFIAILLASVKTSKGISSEALDQIVWPGLSKKSAANNRGVTKSKLQQVLNKVEGIHIENEHEHWRISLSDKVFCDYAESIEHIKSGKVANNAARFQRFYALLYKGSLLPHVEEEWLDEYKGAVASEVIDIFIRFMDDSGNNCPSELTIKLCDRILKADPLNEEAIRYKVQALKGSGQHNKARFTKDEFTRRYKELLNEDYKGVL